MVTIVVSSATLSSNYPTRSGSASEDSMCDSVSNTIPSELTFITKHKYYSKYTHAYNIPIVSSDKVSDDALKRACYVVRFMLADRLVLRQNMYKYQVKNVIEEEFRGPSRSFYNISIYTLSK